MRYLSRLRLFRSAHRPSATCRRYRARRFSSAIRYTNVSFFGSSVSQKSILKQGEIMDVQKINAVGTEYGGMVRAVLAGDPEALGRPCRAGVH